MLSVLFVFTLPEPIRPNTSIGMMNMLAIIALVITLLVKGRRASVLAISHWGPLQVSVMGYMAAVLVSLLLAETIRDGAPFRLLFSGVVIFWVLPEIRPTEKQKKLFIHVLGAVAVGIALLSFLQVIFPEIMNSFADIFLRGRHAYGITIEFNRGRLLHWGALIFIFPFFYSSTLLLPWRSRFWTTLYIFAGYSLLMGSMVMANFRGEFLVYGLVSFIYMFLTRRSGYISKKKLLYLVLIAIVMITTGLIAAKLVLGYNLLDRFLLSNLNRDVTETMGRITLYRQAITVFLASPIVGVGYGNYYSVVWPFPIMQYYNFFDQLMSIPVPIASHNEFFTVLAETGALGFIGFLLVLFFIGKRIYILLFRSMKLDGTDAIFSLTVGASYLSLIIYIWFENIYPQNIVYILVMGGIITHWINFEKTA